MLVPYQIIGALYTSMRHAIWYIMATFTIDVVLITLMAIGNLICASLAINCTAV